MASAAEDALTPLFLLAGPDHGNRKSSDCVFLDFFDTSVPNFTGVSYGSTFLSCTLETTQATNMEWPYEWHYRALCPVNTGVLIHMCSSYVPLTCLIGMVPPPLSEMCASSSATSPCALA